MGALGGGEGADGGGKEGDEGREGVQAPVTTLETSLSDGRRRGQTCQSGENMHKSQTAAIRTWQMDSGKKLTSLQDPDGEKLVHRVKQEGHPSTIFWFLTLEYNKIMKKSKFVCGAVFYLFFINFRLNKKRSGVKCDFYTVD